MTPAAAISPRAGTTLTVSLKRAWCLSVLASGLIACLTNLSVPVHAQSKEQRKEEKKRGEQFAKDVGRNKYGRNTVAGQIDEQFKLHIARGACGFFDPDILPADVAYVPGELRTQAAGMMNSPGESLIVNGQNIFWYVYKESEINQALPAVDPNRILGISPLIQGYMEVVPSDIFPAWIMARNCAGYLNASFGADAKFPVGSADLAVKSDYQNKSTISLIGGLFRSPINDLVSKGRWQDLLLNLELWNIYKSYPDLRDNAWYMNNFQGIMIQRKSGTSLSFDSSASVTGGLPLPLVNINAQLKAGMTTNSTFELKDYKTVMISDVSNGGARRARFTKLPTVDEIVDKFSRAELNPEGVEKPLLKNRLHSHNQVIYGVPRSVCIEEWDLNNPATGVLEGVVVRAKPDEVTAQDRKIPVCSFTIEGTPANALFQGNATQQLPATFSATLRTRRPLPGSTKHLQRQIEQSLQPSSQPLLRVTSIQPVDFSSSNQEGSALFKLSWRDITIDFDDNFEPVNRKPGAVALPDQVTLNCENTNVVVTGEAVVGGDGKYHLTLSVDRLLSHGDYMVSSSSAIPCTYETNLAVPLNRAGNPLIRRTLNLRLKIPTQKPVIQPAPAPNPVPTTTPSPNPPAQPTPSPMQ